MKFLITGSEGSLAQIVIPYLLEQNYEVIGIDNFSRYGEVERNRDYEFFNGDLTDTSVIKDILNKNNFDLVTNIINFISSKT